LCRGKGCVEDKIGHADDAAHRRADFMTDIGQELALGPGGRLSSVPCRSLSGIQRRLPHSDRGLRRKAFEEALVFWGEMEWLATG
jgi:hypothetical protein